MSKNLPALLPQPVAPDLVKEIALDIGKAVSHHIETMYSAAVDATSKNMLLSVRNCVYNEIIAALAETDPERIAERLKARKKHRREINALRRAADDLGRQREADPPKSVDQAIHRIHDAVARQRAAGVDEDT